MTEGLDLGLGLWF